MGAKAHPDNRYRKEANVSQVTIYNYFGSKEALLKEVLKIISISPSASLKNI
ncbi:TetR/AcrR family transcriptional regulator [Bacillus licheniformis]|nr:TetR/AcrR family transcriptional regulator [Bacillus licheniformis]